MKSTVLDANFGCLPFTISLDDGASLQFVFTTRFDMDYRFQQIASGLILFRFAL